MPTHAWASPAPNVHFVGISHITSERKERTNTTLATEALRAFETIRHHSWKATLAHMDANHNHLVLSGFHTLFELRAALIGALEAREDRKIPAYRFPIICHIDQKAIASNKSTNPYLFKPPVQVPTMIANFPPQPMHPEEEPKDPSLHAWFITLQSVGADGFLLNSYTDALKDCPPLLKLVRDVATLPVAFCHPEAADQLTEAAHCYQNYLYATLENYDQRYWDHKDAVPPHCLLTHPNDVVSLALKDAPIMIGQNINPSCFRRLKLDPTSAPMTPGAIDLLVQEAHLQVQNGASVLNVNLGPLENTTRERAIVLEEREKVENTYRNYPYYYHKAYLPLADSKIRAMANLVYALVTHIDRPLSIDTSRVDVLETVLKLYPGRLLINSVTDHPQRTDQLLPLAKKYGAAIVIMPIADRKPFPRNAAQRCTIAKNILLKAFSYGLSRRDVVFDGITLPVTLTTLGVRETLDTLALFRETFRSPTILGICNLTSSSTDHKRAIFQQRQFLTMALSHGLSAAIMNPCNVDVRDAFLGAKHLLGYDTPEVKFLYRENIPDNILLESE